VHDADDVPGGLPPGTGFVTVLVQNVWRRIKDLAP
jgi:hypothetical protein